MASKKYKDMRGKFRVTPPEKELKDYSGPFKSDIRYSDFTKETLVKMFKMAHELFMESEMAWTMTIAAKYGWDDMLKCNQEVWVKTMPDTAREIFTHYLNFKGKGIEGLMKALQMDPTWCPVKFGAVFEMPSEDHGIVTLTKCPMVDLVEGIGQADAIGQLCDVMCSQSMNAYIGSFGKNIVKNDIVMPPRKGPDDICCQFEFTYKK